MDIEENLNRHERSIGRIEGTLESLATKDFVRKEVHEAIKVIDAKIDTKFDTLTDRIDKRFSDLSDKIEHERR